MLRCGSFTLSTKLLLILFCFAVSEPLVGVTLDDLRNDSQLTPERFGAYFAKFEYQFRADVQSPEIFLATRSGDCDDYATLAADILKEKGYTPHLIAVRMKKLVHVVCYIEETKSYLDFNNRKDAVCTVRSDGSFADIAQHVAKSFKAGWTSVSEFTYEGGVKRLVTTLVRTESSPKDQPIAEIASAKKLRNF